jgi:hypothetical protein
MEVFFGIMGLLMWLAAIILALYIVYAVGFVINVLALLTFLLFLVGCVFIDIANG